jgi:hypothetical protein
MGEARRRQDGEEAFRAQITKARAAAAKFPDLPISVMDIDEGRWRSRSGTEMRETFRVGEFTAEMTFDTITRAHSVRFLPYVPVPNSLSSAGGRELSQIGQGGETAPPTLPNMEGTAHEPW